MRIGVDLDGVVYNSEDYFRAEGELLDIKLNGKGVVDYEAFDLIKKFGWKDKLNESLEREIKRLRTMIVKKAPFIPCSVKVLNMLKNDGHEIVIITNRGQGNPPEIPITKKRLKRDKIPYSKIIFCEKSKKDSCIENKIDVMIDDRHTLIKEICEVGIKGLYFRNPELPKINHENATEVHNWGEIYREISSLKI